jgi:hypothetical protein
MVDRKRQPESSQVSLDALVPEVVAFALDAIEQAFPEQPDAQRIAALEVSKRLSAGMLGRQEGRRR